MNRKLLDKWLNGEISPSEKEALKKDPVFAEYLKIDSFVKQIKTPSQDTSEGLAALKDTLTRQQKPKVIQLGSVVKVAIAATIVVMIGYFYLSSLPQTFSTQISQTEILELPDNSTVTLNSNSQLQFNEGKWNEDRSLDLEGEAYFEVVKGSIFEVHTTHGTVSVLGTRFNVYDRGDNFEVVCYEGSVKVAFGDDSLKLSPGEMAFLKDGELISDIKYTSHPGWINDESTFANVKIEAVLQELKSVYSINVFTENIDVDLRYTGSFTNRDLDSALQTITLPLGLQYAIENKNVTIFAKE